MKLALISARPKIANKKANLKTIEQYLQKESADCYIFGELFLTGYRCKDEFRSLAEPLDGPSITYLTKLAQKTQSYIVFGMPLKNPQITGLIHNSAILIHPNGTVDHYDKWFLPTFGPFEEKIYFDEGEHLPVFTTEHGKIGLLICYDIFFPELSRALTLQGAELIAYISASPSTARSFFETLIPGRALENTVFVGYTNLVGSQDDLVFWGGSQVSDPLGNQLVKAPYFQESIISCDIDFSLIERTRPNRPILRDIRPPIYQDLYNLARYQTKATKKHTG
jgi:predicted amidohydrolase